MAPSDEGTVVSEDSEDTNEIQLPTQPNLKIILGAELQALALVGIDLKKKIDSAKTTPKKRLYKKKLEKNSRKAAELILYLERLQITEAIEQSKQKQEFIDIRDNEDEEGKPQN